MSDTKAARIVGAASACLAQGGRIPKTPAEAWAESVSDIGRRSRSITCLPPYAHRGAGIPFGLMPALLSSFLRRDDRYSNPEWNVTRPASACQWS